MTSRDRDFGRKYESGGAKRKKIEKRKDEEKKLSGSLTKFFKPSAEKDMEVCCAGAASTTTSSSVKITTFEDVTSHHNHSCVAVPVSVADSERPTVSQSSSAFEEPASSGQSGRPIHILSSTTCLKDNNMNLILSKSTGLVPVKETIHPLTEDPIDEDNYSDDKCADTDTNLDVTDPFLWPKVLNDHERIRRVKKGPVRLKIGAYPTNEDGRHFSNTHFTKTLVNGEKQDRRWLVYSASKDAVFCFACKLFSTKADSLGALGSHKGVNDWKHLSEYLKSHENSKHHKECMFDWFRLQKGLAAGKTIDADTQAQIESEQQRWRDVLQRLLAIVKFLASHNLSFRGHEEKMDTPNSSGNFLDLVKLLAQFDPVLREHVGRVLDKSIPRNHYLSKTTQNELIEIMASHVKSKIIEKVKKNKYFSIILDCTRDISRVEQLSVILRTTNQDIAQIEEYFLEFVAVEKTTAERLSDYIIEKLEELGISLADCRGQGYDNGANMRGEKSGVQRRLLNLNSLAFFVPCGCHSWNLVLGDAASSCAGAQTFFGTLQRLYTIFSCSSERWGILKSYVTISLKPLSETRWECRSESVKAVRYQLSEVIDALVGLRENSTDCSLISECQSLENEISSFEFVLSLVIWYDILVKIHTISKVWQSDNMQLDVAIKHLETFLKWLGEYRNQGFQDALVSAREVAEGAGIEMKFKTARIRRKKRMFQYEKQDEVSEMSPQENFRINYFLVIVDAVQASCEPRFSALKTYESKFGFMYRLLELRYMSDEELMKNCKDLHLTLSCGEHHDIDALELYEEIKMLSGVYEGEGKDDILSVLKFITINNLKDVYPNVFVALRIIATIPVTVASAERSFSKLKLIKTYLRNSMTQDRLSSLALLSIENELVSKVDFQELIDEFSQRKSRRVKF